MNLHPLAAAACAGVLALGVGGCNRERAETDTQSAATTPADTAPAPVAPADTTGSDTANTTETPNTPQGSDVTAEAPMDESNPTGTTGNPPPVTEQTDQSDLNRDTIKAEPPGQTDTDEAQAPQKY